MLEQEGGIAADVLEISQAQTFFQYKGYQAFNETLVNEIQYRCDQRNYERVSIGQTENLDIDVLFNATSAGYTTVSSGANVLALIMHRLLRPYQNTLFAVSFHVGDRHFVLVDEVKLARVVPDQQSYAYPYGMLVVEKRENLNVRLSHNQWNAVTILPAFSFDGASVGIFKNHLATANIYGHDDVHTTPTASLEERHRQELEDLYRAFFVSPLFVSIVCNQAYLDVEDRHLQYFSPRSVFARDVYPQLIGSSHLQQAQGSWLLIHDRSRMYTKIYGMSPSNTPFADEHAAYYQSFHKTFMVAGSAYQLHDVISRLFGSEMPFNKLSSLAYKFSSVDTSFLKTLRLHALEHFQAENMAVTSMTDKQAFLLIALLYTLFSDVDALRTQEYFDAWLNSFTTSEEAIHDALVEILEKKNGGIDTHIIKPVFSIFNILVVDRGDHGLRSVARWYLFNDDMQLDARKLRTYQSMILAAPASVFSDFHVKLRAHTSVFEYECPQVCAQILSALDVRINTVNFHEEFLRCAEANIEASLVMESVFGESFTSRNRLAQDNMDLTRKFVALSDLPASDPRSAMHSMALHDIRTCVAAWLLAFKLIIAHRLANAKIDDLFFILYNHVAARRPTTVADEEFNYFRVLFNTRANYCPHVAAVIPTVRTIRHHVDRHYRPRVHTVNPTRRFTSIFDFMQKDFFAFIDDNVEGAHLIADLYPHDIGTQDLPSTLRFGAHTFTLEDVAKSLDTFVKHSTLSLTEDDVMVIEETANFGINSAASAMPVAVETLVTFTDTVALSDVHVEPLHQVPGYIELFARLQATQLDPFDAHTRLHLLWLMHSAFMHECLQYTSDLSPMSAIGALVHVVSSLKNIPVDFFDNAFFTVHNQMYNGLASLLCSRILSTEKSKTQFRVKNGFSIPRVIATPPAVTYASRACVRSPVNAARPFSSYTLENDAQYSIATRGTLEALGDALSFATISTPYVDNILDWFTSMNRTRATMPLGTFNTGIYAERFAFVDDLLIKMRRGAKRREGNLNIKAETANTLLDYVNKPALDTENAVVFHESIVRGIHDPFQTFASLRAYLLAAFDGQPFSTGEYYAPIDTYVQARLDGRRSLDIGDSDYYRGSRRNFNRLFLAQKSTFFYDTGTTIISDGYSPTNVSAFVVDDTKNREHAIVYDSASKCHCVATDDSGCAIDDDFGRLTGEVTDVAFEVVGTSSSMSTDELIAYVNDVFSSSTLYPVDQFAWLQFSHVEPLTHALHRKQAMVLSKARREAVYDKQTPRHIKRKKIGAQIFYTPPGRTPYQSMYNDAIRSLTVCTQPIGTDLSGFYTTFVDDYMRHILEPLYSDVEFAHHIVVEAILRQFGNTIAQPDDTRDFTFIKQLDFFGKRIVIPLLVNGAWLLYTLYPGAQTAVLFAQLTEQSISFVDVFEGMSEKMAGVSVIPVFVPFNENARMYSAQTAFLRLLTCMRWTLENPSERAIPPHIIDALNAPPLSFVPIAEELVAVNVGLDYYDPLRADLLQPVELVSLIYDKNEVSTDTISWFCAYVDSIPDTPTIIDIQQQTPALVLGSLYFKRKASSPLVYMLWNTETVAVPWALIELNTDTHVIRNYYAQNQHVAEATLTTAFSTLEALIAPDTQWTREYNSRGVSQSSAHYASELCMAMLWLLAVEHRSEFTVDDVRSVNVRKIIYDNALAMGGEQYAEVVSDAVFIRDTAATSKHFDLENIFSNMTFEEINLFAADDDGADANALRVLPPSASAPVESVEVTDERTLKPYPRCLVHGHEINAHAFGNSLRYVRYTKDESRANAVFVPRRRRSSNLSYWQLKATRNVPANEELLVAYPQGEWLPLLFTGYPYEYSRTHTASRDFGKPILQESYGLRATLTPRAFHYNAGTAPLYAISPMPVCAPRMHNTAAIYLPEFSDVDAQPSLSEQAAPVPTIDDEDAELLLGIANNPPVISLATDDEELPQTPAMPETPSL